MMLGKNGDDQLDRSLKREEVGLLHRLKEKGTPHIQKKKEG
jgi:hypothetical protein